MVKKDDLLKSVRMQQRDISVQISKEKFKKLHHRKIYYDIIDRVDKFIESEEYPNRFITMPGLRGLGKSTIIYQIYDYLINEKGIEADDILYLDVDELLLNFNTDIKTVFEVFLEYYHNTIPVALEKKLFILIDEAQFDKNWAQFAKILFDKTSNIFMFFTGSCALELESNTDAIRRMKMQHIYPMNFKEYLLLNYGIDIAEYDIRNLLFDCTEENVEKARIMEKKLSNILINLNNDPQLELKKFTQAYSFPFALNEDISDIHEDISEVVRRIIKDDLVGFKSYNKVSSHTINQIISFLATKKPGKTKNATIAQSTEISANTIKEILGVLELTQLIFSICAYGPGGKILKNSKEHFFITSNIKASFNYRLGRYDINEDQCYSILVENRVASNLYYLIKKTSDSIGLFYDADRRGVDFIIKYDDNVIPIEVGIGKKTKSQLTLASRKYNSKYSILVSNRTETIEFVNNILYIPLLTFALMT